MSGSSSNKFAVYIAGGRVLAMLAQFIMPVFLTHYLSKADYGLYSQFYLLLTFLGSIFCFGIQSNLFYFFPKYSGDDRSKLVWNNLSIMTLAGFLGTAVLAIPFIRRLIMGGGPIEEYWNVIAFCIFFYIPTNMIGTLAVVGKDKKLATFYPPVDVLLKILIVIPLALIYDSLFAIFIGITVLQLLLCTFVYYYVVRKYGGFKGIASLDITLVREQLTYALPFGGAVIINTLCQRLDKIVSVSFLSIDEYAVYAVAFFGIPGIMQIYDSLVQVNVTNMAKAYVDGSKGNVLALYRNFVRQTLSFSLPLIIICVVFARQFIVFAFSEKYLDSVPYFRIYILTFIVAMVGCGTILRAVGRTKQSFNAYLISTIVYVPICILLIKYSGIKGAIISAVIGSCLPRIIQIIYEMRWCGMPFSQYLPWKAIGLIIGISVGLVIPVVILNYFLTLEIWWAIFLSVVYVIAVYSLQIKHNVFLVTKTTVVAKLKNLSNKITGK